MKSRFIHCLLQNMFQHIQGINTMHGLIIILMNGTSYTADASIRVTVSPLIFIGSAAFALFTVFVSVRKLYRGIAKASIIDRLRQD